MTRNASHIIEQMLGEGEYNNTLFIIHTFYPPTAAEVSLFAERRSDLDLDGDSNFERIARRIIVSFRNLVRTTQQLIK